MAEISNFTLYRGTSFKVRFRMNPKENVSGWTTRLYIKKHLADANTTLEVAGTISDAFATAVFDGIFDVPLSAAETAALASREYVYAFRRTNLGSEDVLAAGLLTVKDAPGG
jgi:hypothetical protein